MTMRSRSRDYPDIWEFPYGPTQDPEPLRDVAIQPGVSGSVIETQFIPGGVVPHTAVVEPLYNRDYVVFNPDSPGMRSPASSVSRKYHASEESRTQT